MHIVWTVVIVLLLSIVEKHFIARILELLNAISVIRITHLLHIYYCKKIPKRSGRELICMVSTDNMSRNRHNVFAPDDLWLGSDTKTNCIFINDMHFNIQ